MKKNLIAGAITVVSLGSAVHPFVQTDAPKTMIAGVINAMVSASYADEFQSMKPGDNKLVKTPEGRLKIVQQEAKGLTDQVEKMGFDRPDIKVTDNPGDESEAEIKEGGAITVNSEQIYGVYQEINASSLQKSASLISYRAVARFVVGHEFSHTQFHGDQYVPAQGSDVAVGNGVFISSQAIKSYAENVGGLTEKLNKGIIPDSGFMQLSGSILAYRQSNEMLADSGSLYLLEGHYGKEEAKAIARSVQHWRADRANIEATTVHATQFTVAEYIQSQSPTPTSSIEWRDIVKSTVAKSTDSTQAFTLNRFNTDVNPSFPKEFKDGLKESSDSYSYTYKILNKTLENSSKSVQSQASAKEKSPDPF